MTYKQIEAAREEAEIEAELAEDVNIEEVNSLKNDLDENYKLTNTFTYVSSSTGNVYRVEPFLKGVESNTDTYKLIKLQ